MTSRFRPGATTNSAPASRAARAVSGSSTVPAPSSTRPPSCRFPSRITSIAFGTVNVTSATLTPPSASARTTSTNGPGSGKRTTATIPQSNTRWRCFSRLMSGLSGGSGPVATTVRDPGDEPRGSRSIHLHEPPSKRTRHAPPPQRAPALPARPPPLFPLVLGLVAVYLGFTGPRQARAEGPPDAKGAVTVEVPAPEFQKVRVAPADRGTPAIEGTLRLSAIPL